MTLWNNCSLFRCDNDIVVMQENVLFLGNACRDI